MKQPRILSSALVLIALSCISAQDQVALNSTGQAWLRTAISSGTFSDLRWPNFSDYSKHLQKFYDFNGGSLWWVKGMEPTPQARQLIALLVQAGQKGLSADDYDGPRWSDRLSRLKPATSEPAEQDAVKFDLALTVSVMRYISDLHIGRVNPKRLAFELDDESKKYDLPEFLRDNVAGAGDVVVALAQSSRRIPVTAVRCKRFKPTSSLRRETTGSSFHRLMGRRKRLHLATVGPACRGSRDFSAWWATFPLTPISHLIRRSTRARWWTP